MGDPDSASLEANMEDHITASLGPMVRLLRRLHSFEVSQQSLPEGLSTHKIKLLEEGLEVLYTYLKDAPEAEDPSCTPKWWIKEVRELSYDTEDYVDEVMDSGAGVRRSARLSTIFRIISKRKRRPQTAKDFSQLMSRVDDARERRKSFKLAPETIRPDSGQAGVSCLTPKLSLVLPVSAASISVHVDTGGGRSIVGVEEPMNKLVNLLAFDNAKEKQLKVIPIFGSAGVGKTTLARTLYHKFGGKFQCRAFLRVSRNPDMRRLLTSMLSQIKAPPRAHALSDAQDLIDTIIEHLGGKRYFIIIDDLWTASAWNIISRALPDSNWCSRIITTTQIEDVALACCGYQSEYIIKMGPLNDGESRKLFFNIVFGSEGEGGCPKDFEEVADGIIRKCGGLPLSIVNIASLLPSKSKLVMEQWEKVQRSLPSTLRTNPTSEGMKDVLILMYNNLPPHLKTCLLYLSMYPEGYTIRKDDLVKQWVAEGFVGDTEHVARGYLDELVGRGMIQPVDTNYNGEVLSCTVNHMVLDLIRYKSMEDNFIIAVDYFESTPGLPDKVRRLSVQFGGAKSAKIPESIVISQVRSLLFRGFFKCVPPIVDYRLLQVLILDIWADQDDASFDLTRICELFRLRYLKIECNVNINLPAKIWSLQYLETLEVDAGLSVVPSDIVHSQSLLHLCLPSQANLPAGIDHMISLRSLGYFNLGNNSRDNVLGLGKLINLWDLRLTCSTVPSDRLIRKMEHLGSILGELSKLKSLILDAGASSLSISCDGLNSVSPAPALLERLKLPRLCIFPSLPMWFRDLNKLCILKIAVEELSKENIDILKGLHALAALSLYVRTTPTGGIVFGKEGFRALRYFKFRCTAPCLTFQKGAMPNVQRLKLRFDDNGLEQYDPVHAGFEHLLGLEEISAKIGSVDVDEYDSKSALWTEVFSELPSSPIFNMQLGDRIFNGDREKSSARNVEKHQTKETVQDVRVEVRSHEQYAIQAFAGEGTSKQAEADTGTPVASGSSLQTQILGEDECKATDTGSALEGPSSKHPNNPDNVNREFAEPIIHDDKETCSTRKEEKHFTPEIKDVTSLRTSATSEISSAQPEAPLQTGTTSEITSLQPEAALHASEERSDEQRGIEKKGPREDMIRQADSSTSMTSGYTAHLQDSGPQRSLVRGAMSARARMEDKVLDKALDVVQWVVGKALALVTDGVLEAWEASKSLGLNVEALSTELLHVQATLEIANGKQLSGQAMEKLLQKLRDSAHDAQDLLDELDYFRIHDGLHGTYTAADEHVKGGVHNLVLSARHTAKVVIKLLCFSAYPSAANAGEPGEEDARQRVNCCAWPPTRQRARGNSSSVPNTSQADEKDSGCTQKLGNILACSSFPSVHNDDDDSGKSSLCGVCTRKAPPRKHAEETPKLGFNRVDVSERMKHVVEQLRPVRRELTTILQSCDRNTIPNTAHSRPNTISRSIEPKLYGRDHIVNSIIHDISKGKYCDKDLTVIPIVGPGGIGKTTMIQHIYQNQEVQTHFQVRIWVCVSLSFNLNKILEQIGKHIPRDEVENEGTTEELIAQRLKSRRFLLVLDDIWECSNEDDWKRLLLPLNRSQEKGSVILVTTRFKKIAQMVKSTNHSIELEGLESKEFRELFYAFVFGDEQCRKDHLFLLQTGDKIMEKLKGSPLAAKTVGKLLRKNINLCHWRRVLESKEWEAQTGSNDIMPALKLSYDYLPFHLQQCFSCSALFPEDYHFRSSELINLWIGLDILQPSARKQTHEDIGLSNLNELVAHGFFREEETYGRPSYVMHDLLHDLALNVASHECLSLHRSNVGSVLIQPCIRHLSIVIDDVGHDNALSGENFKSELRKLKTKLKVEHLQTLMLFGGMDESFASILRDLFWEANALRVLHLPRVSYSVDSILYNFSTLVHLRYLCLGTEYVSQMHLPHTISRFYHLRILNLGSWYGSCDFPKDMSKLVKLCRLYTKSEELHPDICNVGRLKLLEMLKVFRVNKELEGFEPKQLEHLTELRELGIYNLEKIHTREEATEAKLIEKNYLQRLTLDWDSQRSSVEPHMEAVVLESLQPHRDLQHLCIRGHGGPSCPTWLGDELAVEALQSLHLIGVSWEVLPCFGKMWELDGLRLEHIVTMKEFVIEQSFRMLKRLTLIGLESFEKWVPGAVHLFPLLQELIIRDCPKLSELPLPNHIVYPLKQDGKIDWFPKLQQLEIQMCLEFSSVISIPWTETLCSVKIRGVKLLENFEYSKSSSDGVKLSISGKDDLHSLDQVLVFNKETGLEKLILRKCPPLELRHLLMLTSLKRLVAQSCDGLVGPLGGQGDVKWQLPVECLEVEFCGPTGRELTELLAHLPRLSSLTIKGGAKITQLVVGVDVQKNTSTTSELEEDEVVAEAAAELTVEQEKEEDGVLLLPPHLSDSLRELEIGFCLDLVLVAPPTLPPDGHTNTGGGLQALQSLQRLTIMYSPKFLSAYSVSSRLFPSSLQDLELWDVEGMGTLEPLSNLTSLTRLKMQWCGEDLRCEGLLPLLTTGGHLSSLTVWGSPKFFIDWDPRSEVLQVQGGGQEHQLQLVSKLRELSIDDAAGLLAVPICSFLSSSLTKLSLRFIKEMERFSKEQEDALHLLASLQELEFKFCDKLQHLPAGLHKLTNLNKLEICECPAVRSLPNDGLPKSLQELNVLGCDNELRQQCRGLVETIPIIRVD